MGTPGCTLDVATVLRRTASQSSHAHEGFAHLVLRTAHIRESPTPLHLVIHPFALVLLLLRRPINIHASAMALGDPIRFQPCAICDARSSVRDREKKDAEKNEASRARDRAPHA